MKSPWAFLMAFACLPLSSIASENANTSPAQNGRNAPLPVAVLRGAVPEGLPGVEIVNGKYHSTSPSNNTLQCVLNGLGYTIHWAFYPTTRLLNMLEAGELDLAFPMGQTAERDAKFKPSQPLQILQDVWVYYPPAPDLSKRDVSVVVKAGSPQHNWLHANGYTAIQTVNNYSSLLPMLRMRRAEAILVPSLGVNLPGFEIDLQMESAVHSNRNIVFYFNKVQRQDIPRAIDYRLAKCVKTATDRSATRASLKS